MYYYSSQVYLVEIPDHIALGLTILGCPIHCPDCHSKWTWDKSLKGQTEITIDNIKKILSPHVSCLLFLGGEWESDFYKSLLALKELNLPLALYTGRHLVDCIHEPWFNLLSFIKVGPYVKELGGLKSRTTNQRMYKLCDGVVWEEITLW